MSRNVTYERMCDCVISSFDKNDIVCLAVYGHPMFSVTPTLLASKKAKSLGYEVKILPAVSSLDCMLSELEIDPATNGLTIIDAAQSVKTKKLINTSNDLIILQAGVFGNNSFNSSGEYKNKILTLVEYLLQFYREDTIVIVYLASQLPVVDSIIQHLTLNKLKKEKIPLLSSLFIKSSKK